MRFVCRVGTPDGRVLEQTFEAADEAAVRSDLEGRGYHIFEVRRRGLSVRLPAAGEGRRRGSIDDREFLVFNQELAGLLRAGLPLLQALDMMLERLDDPQFRSVLSEIRDRVKAGAELSDAFAQVSDFFPRLYPSTLKAGERSGELEQVIRRFIRYQRLVMETKKRVVSALVYPAVLVGLSVIMLVVMTVYVIPRFRGFYEAMDVDLPLVTRAILKVSAASRAMFGLEALPLWVVGAVAAYLMLRQRGGSKSMRRLLDQFKLQLPIVGTILQRFSLSEFCRSLGTLLSGGLPLVPALEVAVGAVGNGFLRDRLSQVVPSVREGKAFYLALEETGVFSNLAIDMVKVGETTGALDEMMTNVSDFFDEEVETRLQRLLSLVEPIMLVVMGLLVSFLLVAMYLPLFSILRQLQ